MMQANKGPVLHGDEAMKVREVFKPNDYLSIALIWKERCLHSIILIFLPLQKLIFHEKIASELNFGA